MQSQAKGLSQVLLYFETIEKPPYSLVFVINSFDYRRGKNQNQ